MLREQWWGGRKCRQFTLQWHLTNRCGFHCRHCYDRNHRVELELPQAEFLVHDLKQFCRTNRVRPHISLTGGDPLLYPHFWEIYQQLAEERIPVSMLGNPVDLTTLRRLISIQLPAAYQVSLEGLEPHNDQIRGQGHFQRVIDFLEVARSTPLVTHVMVTLTAANIDQVLPLGQRLRGLSHRLVFNRLAQLGEGKSLAAPGPEKFREFLEAYLLAWRTNPMLVCKDNLFNILRYQQRKAPLRGCTGYGCGAAFNFLAVLPDGEVHACRKVPSLLGNLRERSLHDLYWSETARKWRQGPEACRPCPIRKNCRGCPAVTAGQGGDPLTDKDPQCFWENAAAKSMRLGQVARCFLKG